MPQKNPFEEFVNGELAGKIDFFGKGTSQQRPTPLTGSQSGVIIAFYQDSSENIISIILEGKYDHRFKPEGSYIWSTRMRLPPTVTLADFVADYYAELEHRDVLYDKEKVMLGETAEDGAVYKQRYHDTSGQMGEEVTGILAFLKQKYKQ